MATNDKFKKKFFEKKQSMTPFKYLKTLKLESVRTGIITKEELDSFMKSFTEAKLSTVRTIQSLETIVRLRHEATLPKKVDEPVINNK